MRRLTSLTIPLFVLGFVIIPTQTFAQEQSAESQLLGLFVGSWTYDHIEGGTECSWLGDHIVHCRGSWITADGNEVEAVFLTRYDEAEEMWRAHRYYNSGYADSAVGWLEDGTWTFVYETPSENRVKFTGVISGDKWTYDWHRSVHGGPWEKTSEGSMTKVQ
jgi:hypothetical protein